MPPKAKITKNMIPDAAFQVIRERGIEQMNARTIAQKLNCSTQPVLYHFHTIEEIQKEAYRIADEFHFQYILPKGERGSNPLLELGLNYIRFGHEEKNLFRFLFQTNGFRGRSMQSLIEDPAAAEMVQMVAGAMHGSTEEAAGVFFRLFISAHGIASLLANNAMEYEEETFARALESIFRGQAAPQKEEESS